MFCDYLIVRIFILGTPIIHIPVCVQAFDDFGEASVMKKQSVIYSILGVTLSVFAAAAVSGILISAKSAPEAVTDTPITPDNFTEQKAALEEIDPAELEEVLPHDGDTLRHDADSNFYRFDENGKLIGIEKLAAQDESDLPDLTEEELREYAQLYFEGLVDDTSRYTLEEFAASSFGTYDVHWDALCCGYKTTDVVSVSLKKNGTLQRYFTRHTGDFADVTVTPEQIGDAIARAVEMAEGPNITVTKVDGPDGVVITHDASGDLMLNVSISRKYTDSESGLTFSSPDHFQVPIL